MIKDILFFLNMQKICVSLYLGEEFKQTILNIAKEYKGPVWMD